MAKTPGYAQEMLDVIDAFELRAWSADNKGFKTGWDQFDDALEGIQTGWHLIAGDSNIGKTSFLSQLAWQVANHPDNDAYVIDFSLDDPMHEKLPRVVAAANKVLINSVRTPNNYMHLPNMIARRNAGIDLLKKTIHCYKAYDANHSTDIDKIEETIKRHIIEIKAIGSKRRVVVFIDNFHDLTTSSKEASQGDKNKYDYLAQRISDMATLYDIPIITTAEFKKLNGNRRPHVDDIRESVKIKYEAKSIMLCYNEVGVKGESAGVYFEIQGNASKQPVFEVKFGKNKYTRFKGRLFFEFYPEMARFEQALVGDVKRYNNLIYAND